MKRHSLRRLLSVLLAALLLMSSLATAGATPTVPNDDDALQILLTYGIVKGDPTGNLNLDKEITRAEASTIFVRAMGQEQTALLMKDLVTFDDAKGHWGAGFIAVAFRLGLMKGRSDTQFDPDAKITNQEVYTVILRMVKREPLGTWNPMLVMQTSRDLGLTPSNIDLGLLGPVNALRRTIFNALGKAVSGVALPDGKTILGTYIDTQAPTLHLDAIPASTGSRTVKVSGTADGATQLDINGQLYRLTTNRFSIDVTLVNGNNTLVITALDWAGNKVSQTAMVARATAASRIVVAGDLSVKAGQSVPFQAIAYDADNVALAATDVSATVSNNLGRYDAATGKFIAGSTGGTGTITFTAGTVSETTNLTVLGVASTAKSIRIKDGTSLAGSLNKNTTVQVEVLDVDGNAIAYDDGRTVSLVATGLSGARVVNATATTVKGIATFTVTSSVMGEVTLTAASSGLSNDVGSLVFASSTRIKLIATPAVATGDGVTPVAIRASLVDENGRDVTNSTGSDLFITLSTRSATGASTDSGFSNPQVIIRRNASSSVGSDAQLIPGFKTESVKVTGTVTSGQSYTVLPVTVEVKEIVRGAASKLDLAGGAGFYTPGVTPVNLVVRVTDKDGNLIPDGTYAFQVEVTTSNNDPVFKGVPDGLNLQIGSNDGNPIKGATTADAVIGRTKFGTANLKLTYNKSGIITVKVIGVAATDGAVDQTGTVGAALSTTGFTNTTNTISFIAPLAGLSTMVESSGTDIQTSGIGVMQASTSSSVRVKVYMVDSAGGRIPNGTGSAKLTKVAGTVTTAPATTATFANGVAEFTIRATAVAGHDTWLVTWGTGPAAKTVGFDIYTATTATKLSPPDLLSVNGESGSPNRVTVADRYMNIELDGAYTAGTYGYVKVFRSGTTAAIWTSGVIDLGNLPAVQVPVAKVSTGSYSYSVSVYNGVESDKSNASPIVVRETAARIDISKVRYNGSTATLYITASGLASTGRMDGNALTVSSATTGSSTKLTAANCTYSSSTTFACAGVDLPAAQYNGDVTLITADGWYVQDSNGSAATAETAAQLANNKIGPMAYISQATTTFTYDASGAVTGGKLTLEGKGLASGTLDLAKIQLSDGTTTQALVAKVGTVATNVRVDSRTNDLIAITLGTLAGPIAALDGTSVNLDATTGWYALDGALNTEIMGVNVYTKTNITRVEFSLTLKTLTIYGTGFKNATVNPSALAFKRRTGAATAFTVAAPKVSVNTAGTAITIDLAGSADLTGLDNALTAGSTYLIGDPGWLLNGFDWPAAPIDDRVLLIRRA